MRLRACWSCHSHAACYDDCGCAKCIDPEGYDEWKTNNPGAYADWLESQTLDDDEPVDDDEEYY